MTTEAARMQGFCPQLIHWNNKEPENHYMLGNTISVPVLHRIYISTIRAMGFDIDDPWEAGTAQQHLIQSAEADKIPPNFRMTRTVEVGNTILIDKQTNRPKQAKQVTLLRYYHQTPRTPPPPSHLEDDHYPPADQLPLPPCYQAQRFAQPSAWTNIRWDIFVFGVSDVFLWSVVSV